MSHTCRGLPVNRPSSTRRMYGRPPRLGSRTREYHPYMSIREQADTSCRCQYGRNRLQDAVRRTCTCSRVFWAGTASHEHRAKLLGFYSPSFSTFRYFLSAAITCSIPLLFLIGAKSFEHVLDAALARVCDIDDSPNDEQFSAMRAFVLVIVFTIKLPAVGVLMAAPWTRDLVPVPLLVLPCELSPEQLLAIVAPRASELPRNGTACPRHEIRRRLAASVARAHFAHLTTFSASFIRDSIALEMP